MIEITRRKISPERVDKYFTNLKNTLDGSLSRILMGKAEAGTSRGERGYQIVAASTAGSIARAIGCSEDKAKALSMAVGIYFPKYGHAGLKAVKQYIVERNIDLDLADLGVVTICNYLSANLHIVPEVIYDLLHDYFYGIDSCQEIQVVRLVQDTIMEVKKAEHFYEGQPGNLLFAVTQELVDLAREHKKLMPGTLLEKYKDKTVNYRFPDLTDQERQDVYDTLDQYVHDFTSNTGEMEKYNRTPEEAVVIYIYMES